MLNLDRVKPNEFKMKEDACINCEKRILKRYTHILWNEVLFLEEDTREIIELIKKRNHYGHVN